MTVLQSIDWEVLVVDEAHRLKNNQSKVCGMERGGRRDKRESVKERCFALLLMCNFLRAKVWRRFCDMRRKCVVKERREEGEGCIFIF